MKKTTLIACFCIVLAGMHAQDSNNELLKKLVEKQVLTQTEADQISQESEAKTEYKASFGEKVEKVREAFNTPYMKFGGYGLLMHKYSDVARIKNNIEPRVIFLNVGGKLTDKFGYYILAELVNPLVYEFYAEWTPAKEFNFRVGQFKVPFSLENPISLTNLETIANTRSVSSLVGMSDDIQRKQNDRNNTGRDIGLQASGSFCSMGDHDLVQYAAGIFQGSGLSSSERNNSKDFSGTLLIQPIKGFRIGGGAYFGEATYATNDGDPEREHVRNRWALSADYVSDRFYSRAEWIHGKDGTIDREGLYGTAQYYIIPKKLNAAAKVDYYNKDKDINSEVIDYTAAVNYFFYPQCRVQLNYTYSDYSNKWGDKNSNVVLAQLLIVF